MAGKRGLPAVFSRRVVVFDGAMGSLLIERGVHHAHPLEELNLSKPYLVCQAHADYIKAGADVIETNTFAANRFRMARHGLENRIVEINAAGARLARSVAGDSVLVAGSVGPLGVKLAPIGPVEPDEVTHAVEEQLAGLLDGGVDLLVVETQTDLEIACRVLEVISNSCDLPIICQFALGSDLTTSDGDTLDDIVSRVSEHDVAAVGVNCVTGPEQTLRAVKALKEITDLPVSAQPNSGFPAHVDGRTLFVSGPAYFAARAAEMVKEGASILGGCCGTTPAHIEALASTVKCLTRPIPARVREPRRREPVSVTCGEAAAPLTRKMNGDFVTVEVTPPRDSNYRALIEKLRPLVDAGISAIDVTDNPMAHVHMSAVAFAHLVREELGIATILHLTCRDLNLLGMHSTLLGADALGIDGILALTGDPASAGDYPAATSVFDVTSDGLARIVSSLNRGVDYAGKPLGKCTNFAIGAAFNPLADDMEKELARLQKKRDSGADFLMTQPVFEIEPLVEAVKLLPADWRPPILVGVLPLRSSRHAEFLHNEIPGISIPDEIRERLASSGPEEAKAEGVRIAQEIYAAAKKQFGGVYFMPPFDRHEVVLQVITGK